MTSSQPDTSSSFVSTVDSTFPNNGSQTLQQTASLSATAMTTSYSLLPVTNETTIAEGGDVSNPHIPFNDSPNIAEATHMPHTQSLGNATLANSDIVGSSNSTTALSADTVSQNIPVAAPMTTLSTSSTANKSKIIKQIKGSATGCRVQIKVAQTVDRIGKTALIGGKIVRLVNQGSIQSQPGAANTRTEGNQNHGERDRQLSVLNPAGIQVKNYT